MDDIPVGKRFQRRVEDFVCGHCGTEVVGNGFTNHCPGCLWSAHVDVFPGDRAARCGALMEPVALDRNRDGWDLTHRCLDCGTEKKNRTDERDDFNAVLALAKEFSKKRNKEEKK